MKEENTMKEGNLLNHLPNKILQKVKQNYMRMPLITICQQVYTDEVKLLERK